MASPCVLAQLDLPRHGRARGRGINHLLTLVAIFGPTAVGKTEIAIELAALLRDRGERPVAVSADAFQVYEGLETLTAKPTVEQLGRLEHRLISFVPANETFSVAQFGEQAHLEIDRLFEQGHRPIVVGGTGLYLRAALTELELKPPPDRGLREEIEQELLELGLKALHSQLPSDTGDAVNPRDRKRIVRALELERMGEELYTTSDQLWSTELRRPAMLFGIVMDRESLAKRVSERVDRMVAGGLVDEVELALQRGVSKTARKAIGFKEAEAVLGGELSRDQAADQIKRRHRQYVRRQLTWMRKLPGVELVDRTTLSAGDAAASILQRLSATVESA
jgi:tRNA dimethylallyltransferase